MTDRLVQMIFVFCYENYCSTKSWFDKVQFDQEMVRQTAVRPSYRSTKSLFDLTNQLFDIILCRTACEAQAARTSNAVRHIFGSTNWSVVFDISGARLN